MARKNQERAMREAAQRAAEQNLPERSSLSSPTEPATMGSSPGVATTVAEAPRELTKSFVIVPQTYPAV